MFIFARNKDDATMNLINNNLPTILSLCKQHKVKSLYVFGSILTDRFNDNSDVDLLVNFDTSNHEEWDYVSNFFDFQDSLETLFGRKVDLVEEKGLKNKFFIRNLDRTKKQIYLS
jgi:predicted nucleotidyltransferase